MNGEGDSSEPCARDVESPQYQPDQYGVDGVQKNTKHVISRSGLAPSPPLEPPKAPGYRVVVERFCREPESTQSVGRSDQRITGDVDPVVPNKTASH